MKKPARDIMRGCLIGCLGLGVLLVWPGTSGGQDIRDAVQKVRSERMRAKAKKGKVSTSVRARLEQVLTDVVYEDVRGEEVLRDWSAKTGIKLIMKWDRLEDDGVGLVDRDQRITMRFKAIKAGKLLDFILRQISPEEKLIRNDTDYYVAILTKRQANKRRVLRTYHIGELVMTVPSFKNAPSFDLNDALSNTSSGGSGGNRGKLFDDDREGERAKSKSERGNEIVELIMRTVEPGIWDANGGQSSVRYFKGNLVVNAPAYVHEQIGIASTRGPVVSRVGKSGGRGVTMSSGVKHTRVKMRKVQVSGVEKKPIEKTSSVNKE
ncbi:hypothetical protein [Poriferisphaera corsica]|nr:hypothetical protein [Poriferisphaera corsica]